MCLANDSAYASVGICAGWRFVQGWFLRSACGVSSSHTEPQGPGRSRVSMLETACSAHDNQRRSEVADEHWDDSAATNESIAVTRGARNLILTLDQAAFRAAVIFVNMRRHARAGGG